MNAANRPAPKRIPPGAYVIAFVLVASFVWVAVELWGGEPMRTGTDVTHDRAEAAERRKLKAELKRYRLKVIIDHLACGCETREIAQRLGIGVDVARPLIAEVKRGRS